MKTIPFINLLFIISIPLLAQDPGDLFMDFGTDGIFISVMEDTTYYTNDMGVLSDGSLIIAGTYLDSDATETKISEIKLNNRGDQVPFGNSAYGFDYNFTERNEIAAICILPDDKIAIAVKSMFTFDQPHLIMLHSDGDPVRDFGDNGIFTYVQTMFVADIGFFQPEGDYFIVMCGYSRELQPMLLMIDQTGEPVSDFGVDGLYTSIGMEGTFENLVIDHPSSQMFVNGHLNLSTGSSEFLAKYDLLEGYRDAGFGVDGLLIVPEETGFHGVIHSMVYESSTHTLTAFGDYSHAEGDRDIFAYRVDANGGIADHSFGINGWSAMRVPGSNEYMTGAVGQPDGKYCFGGQTDYHGNKDFLIGRINADGFLDTSFGNNGILTTDIYAGSDNRVIALALSPESDVLYAAGSTFTPEEDAMVSVAAYHTGYESEPGVGLRQDAGGQVSIFPNPAKEMVRIRTGQSGLHRVQILDLTGKTVYHGAFTGETTLLNLDFLPGAIYVIRITLPDDRLSVTKLLKK